MQMNRAAMRSGLGRYARLGIVAVVAIALVAGGGSALHAQTAGDVSVPAGAAAATAGEQPVRTAATDAVARAAMFRLRSPVTPSHTLDMCPAAEAEALRDTLRIAAAYGHGVVIALFFLASFFPVGAFLMPTDHWLKWVGWLDLGLLVAAVLIWVTSRRAVVSA